jgi:hypothetical protein
MDFNRMYRRILELARPWNPELVLRAWHAICTSAYYGLLGRTPIASTFPDSARKSLNWTR